MAAASQQKLSRDDWRKKKELEEARKAGTAPAEVDLETGRLGNCVLICTCVSMRRLLVLLVSSSYP